MDSSLILLSGALVVLVVAGVISAGILRRRNEEWFETKTSELYWSTSAAAGILGSAISDDDFLQSDDRMAAEGMIRDALAGFTIGGWRRRLGSEDLRYDADAAIRGAQQTLRDLSCHNDEYIDEEVTLHSGLLVDRLHLSPEQCVAAVTNDRRNLVVAAAGSGKTRVLVARVLYLIARGIPPERILVVTYTNNATDEIAARLREAGVAIADWKAATRGVVVSTLHGLGNRIVQHARPVAAGIGDDKFMKTIIRQKTNEAILEKSPRLAELYFSLLVNFFRSQRAIDDQSAQRHAREAQYRTLRGEQVRSFGEQIIADFLFRHKVPYTYEANANWAEVGRGRRAYCPDFRLDVQDRPITYIEHWGIDENGNVPEWFGDDRGAYREAMAWKRAQYAESDHCLIETYDYERRDGTLEDRLRERLLANGIRLERMSLSELRENVAEFTRLDNDIVNLLTQFVRNARALRLHRDDVAPRAALASPRVQAFSAYGAEMLAEYEEILAEPSNVKIDFADMMYGAAEALDLHRHVEFNFQHIIVDEFQDISPDMMALIQALLKAKRSRLFAVGDDWQGIFGWAGGDVSIMVNFQHHFGPCSLARLSANYRSPASVVAAGTALIHQNQHQIPKEVHAQVPAKGSILIHTVANSVDSAIAQTAKLVAQEVSRTGPDSVMVLARTNWPLEKAGQVCRAEGIPVVLPGENQTNGVRFLSVHRAKGTESRTVIVLDASEGLYGFPSQVQDPDVLEPVRLTKGDSAEEERRLFYVAMTRTTETLHFVARDGQRSRYLDEIERSQSASGPGAGDLYYVAQVYELTPNQREAKMAQSGSLRKGAEEIRFVSWMRDDPPPLAEGAHYQILDPVELQPFRGKQQMRIARHTTIRRVERGSAGVDSPGTTRPLRIQSAHLSAVGAPAVARVESPPANSARGTSPINIAVRERQAEGRAQETVVAKATLVCPQCGSTQYDGKSCMFCRFGSGGYG
ncbi:MAG: UvrD-helicase domain-containing protein [Thermoplasmatota archaeon]